MAVLWRMYTIATNGTRVANVTADVGPQGADVAEAWRVQGNKGHRGADSSAETRMENTSAISGLTNSYEFFLLIETATLAGGTTDIGMEMKLDPIDNSDFYRVDIYDGNIELAKRLDGDGGTVLDSASFSWAINTQYELKIRFEEVGANLDITVLVDDVEILTYLDTSSPHFCDWMGPWGYGVSPNDTGWFFTQLTTQDVVSTASAVLTGTATASINEGDIVVGGKTIVITLTGDTWIPA